MADARLQELRDRLSADDVAGALALYDDAEAALQEQAERERGLNTLARGINVRTSAADQASQAATQFLDAVNDARNRRLEHTTEWFAFTEGDLPTDEFASRVETLIDAHETVDQRAGKLHDHKRGVPLPVLVMLTGPDQLTVPKGEPIEFVHTLDNLGSRDADAIEITVDAIESAADAFGFDVDPSWIDDLPGDASEDLTVTGTAATTGRVTVEVDAQGENVAETNATAIEVVDKSGYLEQALEVLDNLEDQVEQKYGDSGAGRGNGGRSGLLNKLDTARQRLEAILTELEGGVGNGGGGNGGGSGGGGNGRGNDSGGPPIHSIDNRIEAVIELLNAVRNQLDGLAGSQLTEKEAGTLRIHTTDVIVVLESAVDADA